jgi:hypothetical protein
MRYYFLTLAFVPCLLLAQSSGPEEQEFRQAEDIKTVQRAGVAPEGPALVEFFRLKTVSDDQRRSISELVQQLGSGSYRERENATKRLIALGPAAAPALQQALKSSDAEVVTRAQRCLRVLKTNPPEEIMGAAARLLASRPAPKAVEALLAYIPDAPAPEVEEDIARTLATLGVHEGKPDPALVKAAKDALPGRRIAAAAALARAKGDEYRDAARQLLKDADPRVRLFTAQTLVGVGDKTAVPVLIALVEEASQALSAPAEEILYQLGQYLDPPESPTATDQATRKKYRAAWDAWWKTHEAKVDLTQLPLEERPRGLTLMCTLDNGTVGEMDRAGQWRWKLTGLQSPADVQVLPNGNVLVAEHHGRAVRQRDKTGKVLWEKILNNSPVTCRRLANGNIFIATYSQLLEVDRTGNTRFSFTGGGGQIFGACKLLSGNAVYINSAGRVAEVDRTGREVRAIAERLDGAGYWASVESLPRGRFLCALGGGNKVVEIDSTGKVLWSCNVNAPGGAVRLRNGHTLVASINASFVAEFDRDGREVWKQNAQGRVFRAYRR